MDKQAMEQVGKVAKNRYEFEGEWDLMYPFWGLAYVCAEQPIPEAWRSDFYDQLASDDEVYRNKLEEATRYFGVRWN